MCQSLWYRVSIPAKRYPVPVLVTYALVNKQYMMDLQPDRSMVKKLLEQGIDLYLLNRGQHKVEIPGTQTLTGDIHRPEEVRRALRGMQFDAVVDWIAFMAEEIERDLELFRGQTQQYVFISSASAYQKPLTHYLITESTPLYNPYWAYSRAKIACEERLVQAYRKEKFPITIVRPSHTYDKTLFPVHGGYTVIDRMRKGKPLVFDINGEEHLRVTHRDVMLESAATSLQLHLKVAVDDAVRYYNAAQVVAGPMVASAANSPYLFGRDLWDETRIPLFEQAVEVGGFAGASRGPLRLMPQASISSASPVNNIF